MTLRSGSIPTGEPAVQTALASALNLTGPAAGKFRLVTANLHYGGIHRATGDDTIAAIDCPPNRILHVGKRLDNDVLLPGALGGMGTAYVCPYGQSGIHFDDNVLRIRRFADLPDQLRICA